MTRVKSFNEMTKRRLARLRREIRLNSVLVKDYRNSFGFDPKDVCSFFQGFSDHLQALMEKDGVKDAGNTFGDHLRRYDTTKNLWAWFLDCGDLSWVGRVD